MSSACTESERKAIKHNISQIIYLTKHYGFCDENYDPSGTENHWCRLIERMPVETILDFDGQAYRKLRTITLTKYKIAAYAAYWTNTPLPPPPFPTELDSPQTLIGGRFYSFTNQYIFSRGRGDTTRLGFIQTLLQSKALMQRPDENMVRYAEIKTFEKLTRSLVFRPETTRMEDGEKQLEPNHLETANVQQDVGDGDLSGSTNSTDRKESEKSLRPTNMSGTTLPQSPNPTTRPDEREDHPHVADGPSDERKRYIKRKLRDTVKGIFGNHYYTDANRISYSIPSSSSNYNSTRKMFGALGHLLPHVRRLKLTGKTLCKFARKPAKVSFNRKEEDEIQAPDEEGEMYDIKVNDLSQAVYDFRKSVMEEACEEEPCAVPLGLSEPNKVRVITKGPPATYYILKALQLFMHNKMRKIKQFRLIGEQMNAQVLEAMFGTTLENPLLSGDYSDATNELESWVSEEITQQVIETLKLTDKEADLVRKSLTEHILVLKDAKGKEEVLKEKQKSGQLMGSILSFIWLCIANFALIWCAKEEDIEDDIEFEDLYCLINGDDCLFQIGKRGKSFWETYGNDMGLKPSIGKVYYTDEFCTLNSRMFKIEHGIWKEVPFIQSSLLTNVPKSVRLGTEKIIDPLDRITDIADRAYWLLVNVHPTFRQSLYKDFIENNKETLKSPLLNGIDWFMPKWTSGLGMPELSDKGLILNMFDPFAPSVDEPEYKDYINERDNNEKRNKSRGAVFHMVTNWKKRKFRPVPWTNPRIPGGLDIYKRIATRLPSEPKQLLVKAEVSFDRNIYDKLFPLMVMEVYLTDPIVQNLIEGNFIEAVNEDPTTGFFIQRTKNNLEITKPNGDIVNIDVSDLGKKKRRRKFEEFQQEIYDSEHIKRIKYNAKIWKNNVASGCTKLADYEKISKRTYIEYFSGRLYGKGASCLYDAHGLFDYNSMDDTFSQKATAKLKMLIDEF
jgi:hypothetical protein